MSVARCTQRAIRGFTRNVRARKRGKTYCKGNTTRLARRPESGRKKRALPSEAPDRRLFSTAGEALYNAAVSWMSLGVILSFAINKSAHNHLMKAIEAKNRQTCQAFCCASSDSFDSC